MKKAALLLVLFIFANQGLGQCSADFTIETMPAVPDEPGVWNPGVLLTVLNDPPTTTSLYTFEYKCCESCPVEFFDNSAGFNGDFCTYQTGGVYDITMYLEIPDESCEDSVTKQLNYDPTTCSPSISITDSALTVDISYSASNNLEALTIEIFDGTPVSQGGNGVTLYQDFNAPLPSGNINYTFSSPGNYYIETTTFSQANSCGGRNIQEVQIGTLSTEPLLDAIQSLEGPYPNPAKSNTQLDIELLQPTEISCRVFDLQGREVLTQSEFLGAGIQTLKLNTANISNGVYLLEISDGKQAQTMKLVVQH
ncbi:MAG: T9SS type A sorting domain-containing protein [Bacteroidota bacterium]